MKYKRSFTINHKIVAAGIWRQHTLTDTERYLLGSVWRSASTSARVNTRITQLLLHKMPVDPKQGFLDPIPAVLHGLALLEEDALLDLALGEVGEVLALLVPEALVLALVLALHVLAVDHDDVVDVQRADGGAREEVAVHLLLRAALLAFRKKLSSDEKNPTRFSS